MFLILNIVHNFIKLLDKKMINTKTIKFSLIFVVSFLFFQCGSDKKKVETTGEITAQNSLDSLGIISYHLSNSDYTVKMRLSGINTKKVKNAFSIREDEYSVPIKKDGYLVNLNFRVNNQYNKQIMIPIPNYFEISDGVDENFSTDTLYSRSCQCYITNSTSITNLDGKELYSISDGKCGNSRNCIIFNPNETKEFIIKFDDPIIETQKKLLLFGFDLYWDNPNRRGKTDVGIMLDIEEEIINGLKEMGK